MLTDKEREEIESELKRYDRKKAADVEVLKILQRSRGWISDAELAEAAEILEMPVTELDGVATFYNLIYRLPVGRHVILICDSITCWIMGYNMVRDHLERSLDISLGGTSSDGNFTLLPVACLGACDRAPAMMIDDELHTDLTPKKIDMILETYRRGRKT
jgi:NADH-quinone oxidoreductase subunit E